MRAAAPAVSPAEEPDPDLLAMSLDVWGNDLAGDPGPAEPDLLKLAIDWPKP